MPKSKDPVCGMDVDPTQSKHKLKHEGKDYCFCCQECLEKFKKNPKQNWKK